MNGQHEFEFLGVELGDTDLFLETPDTLVQIPACIEIGLQAGKKGDFKKARQMFKLALKQLAANPESNEQQVITFITYVADTYLNERQYEYAKQWYSNALQKSEKAQSKNFLPFAFLMVRLCQIAVFQNQLVEYRQLFESVQRFYLLSKEADASMLLDPLIDLSWALCVQNHSSEAHFINELIEQIKKLQEEDKLIRLVESCQSNNLSA